MPDHLYPDTPTGPTQIEPSALADLPDGTVVYSRNRGERQPVGVMLLAQGYWRTAGTTASVSQDALADEGVVDELRESTEFWVLALP